MYKVVSVRSQLSLPAGAVVLRHSHSRHMCTQSFVHWLGMNESLLPAWPSFECCGYKGKQVKSPCLLEVDVQVELDDKQIDTEYNINVRTREK